MAGIFSTKPSASSSSSSSGVTKIFGVSIPAGNTVTVDNPAFTDNIMVKWLINVYNDANAVVQSYQVVGNFVAGEIAANYTVYGRTGKRIKNVAVVVAAGTNLELHITNNEAYTLTANVMRLDLIV